MPNKNKEQIANELSTLVEVDASNCDLVEEDLGWIIEAIRSNPKLTTLNLAHNQICFNYEILIKDCIEHPCLDTVHMEGNEYPTSQNSENTEHNKTASTNKERFSLGEQRAFNQLLDCKFKTPDAIEKTIIEIHTALKNFPSDETQIANFFDEIGSNLGNLCYLMDQYNSAIRQPYDFFKKAKEKYKEFSIATQTLKLAFLERIIKYPNHLRHLNLDNFSLTEAGLAALFSSKPLNLEKVTYIETGKLKSSSISIFITHLKANNHLQSLMITIYDENIDALLNLLKTNTLRSLNLYSSSLEESSLKKLLEHIYQYNYFLTKINVAIPKDYLYLKRLKEIIIKRNCQIDFETAKTRSIAHLTDVFKNVSNNNASNNDELSVNTIESAKDRLVKYKNYLNPTEHFKPYLVALDLAKIMQSEERKDLLKKCYTNYINGLLTPVYPPKRGDYARIALGLLSEATQEKTPVLTATDISTPFYRKIIDTIAQLLVEHSINKYEESIKEKQNDISPEEFDLQNKDILKRKSQLKHFSQEDNKQKSILTALSEVIGNITCIPSKYESAFTTLIADLDQIFKDLESILKTEGSKQIETPQTSNQNKSEEVPSSQKLPKQNTEMVKGNLRSILKKPNSVKNNNNIKFGSEVNKATFYTTEPPQDCAKAHLSDDLNALDEHHEKHSWLKGKKS